MKQFQFNYENRSQLRKLLIRIRDWCENEKEAIPPFFHIFSVTLDKDAITDICDIIHEEMPDAEYIGCSTYGNILQGDLSPAEIAIVLTVFESPSTKIEVLQYPLTEENDIDVTNVLIREVEARPWVKAVELLTTIRGMSMTDFCENLQHLRPDVSVFGGGALSGDMNQDTAFVFSGGRRFLSENTRVHFSESGVVFVLYGGDDLNIYTSYVTGWKPLGRELKVTRAERSVLKELDGKPAFDTYYHYLNIANDENFFVNTLEFPFHYRYHDIDILRAPVASNEDGSIVMTSDIQENVKARIAYGDPRTILNSVREEGQRMEGFCPETIAIFSCAARRTFWGDDKVGRETRPFQSLAPTFGFFTSSEFLRTGRYVNQHNVTLVIVAMREGPVKEGKSSVFIMEGGEKIGAVSMIHRMATFINAAADDLRQANRLLQLSAVTDPLTQLFNRGETQLRINTLVEDTRGVFSLIMIDLDNFKQVNDTYGHQTGDRVLTGLADFLKQAVDKEYPDSCAADIRKRILSRELTSYFAGRWGGEEFMVVLPGAGILQASRFAETLRAGFAEIAFAEAGKQTMSLGVTEYIPGETADTLCYRADAALYEAKRRGKNRVVVK